MSSGEAEYISAAVLFFRSNKTYLKKNVASPYNFYIRHQVKCKTEKKDTDSTDNSTTMDINEARTDSRYKSISIMDKRKKKAGRGYTRQDWLSQHQKIVERAVNRTDHNSDNKMVKLTEVLRDRQNKTDQKTEEEEDLGELEVDRKEVSTRDTTEKDLLNDINVCMDRLRNLPNDRKSPKSREFSTDISALGESREAQAVLEEDNVKVPVFK